MVKHATIFFLTRLTPHLKRHVINRVKYVLHEIFHSSKLYTDYLEKLMAISQETKSSSKMVVFATKSANREIFFWHLKTSCYFLP